MRRKRRRGRKSRRKAYKKYSDYPPLLPSTYASTTGLRLSPEVRLVMGVGGAILEYAVHKYFPDLSEDLLRFKKLCKTHSHPETLEKIETTTDEHQLGRSEVIREIANPKKN